MLYRAIMTDVQVVQCKPHTRTRSHAHTQTDSPQLHSHSRVVPYRGRVVKQSMEQLTPVDQVKECNRSACLVTYPGNRNSLDTPRPRLRHTCRRLTHWWRWFEMCGVKGQRMFHIGICSKIATLEESTTTSLAADPLLYRG